MICRSTAVADPGFSRGGGVNTPNFPENCMKSKEFGRPGGGRASLTPPLDPPMYSAKWKLMLDLPIFSGQILNR